MSLVIPVGVGLAVLAFALSGESKAKASPGGGGGGGGAGTGEALTCAQAASKLPPAMRDPMVAIVNGPKNAQTAEAATKLAQSFDVMAAAATTPATLRAPLEAASKCLRAFSAAVANAGGGGVPAPSPSSCTAAVAALPPAYQTPVAMLLSAPATAATAQAAKDYAATLDAYAVTLGGSEAGAFKQAAACLRQYAASVGGGSGGGPAPAPAPGVLVDAFGVPVSCDGTPGTKGKATNPKFQWSHLVQSGDSAFAIAAQHFGPTVGWDRAIELIQANPTTIGGRYLGSKGNPASPQTTQFNWLNPIRPGDRLRIPPPWNPWTDQLGNGAGSMTPFPAC